MGFFGSTEGEYENVDDVEILESEGETISEVLGGEKEEKPVNAPKAATEETDSMAKEKLSDLAEKVEKEVKEEKKPKAAAEPKTSNAVSNGTLIIPGGVTVSGDIVVTGGDLCIQGNIDGFADVKDGVVTVSGEHVTTALSGAKVTVDAGAKLITEKVSAKELVEVYGAIKAEIHAKKVVLTDTAVVSGTITCENVDIADHAKLKGSVSIISANEEDIDSVFE